jgi:hypothetical protein
MTSVSNLYAAKLYSEHPIAVWPLDDDVSYISLINNQQRTFEADSPYPGWSITGGVADDSLSIPDDPSPFDSNIYAGIVGAVPLSDGTKITAKSPDLFLFSECNRELETISISMYVYQNSDYPTSYEVGYEYYDDDTSSWTEVLSSFTALNRKGWVHLQDTFTIQEFDADYGRVIFKATVDQGGISGDYNFIINGITVGQWSETTLSKSLGAQQQIAPESSGLSNKVVLSDQYGILSDNAFYVSENGKLLAINEGIPMIFGSENVTRIYASSDGAPSLIFPNKTMLTNTGRYKDFTLEFWLKIRPVTKESRRIVGPIDNNDGIYVTEGFITLVIDKNFVSHNISEWYRPMIVHVVMKDEFVSMFINGEQVGQIKIDRNSVNLSNGDWMGFYSYEDFNMMEIDCISIFPYSVPLQVAKKRFVWGQGTDPIELINDAFDGDEAAISFSNAKYTVNKVYPDMERWDAGYYNNLIATTNSISVPQYSLPEINLGGRGINEWYEDNNTVNDAEYPAGSHPRFFTFRPNTSTRTNLIPNPSGESTYDVWAQRGAATGQDTSVTALFGSYVTKHVSAAASQTTYIRYYTFNNSQRLPVEGEKAYTGSSYVKADIGNLSTNNLRARIYFYDSLGTIVGSPAGTNTPVVPGGDWVRLSITAQAPSTAVSALLEFSTAETVVSQTWYYDGTLFEESSELLPYFDGSYADPAAKAISTSWSGTPNASVSTMQYWTTEGTNWTEQCYLNFPSLSFLSAPLSAIYGIFEVEEEVEETRPLIHIVNTLTGKRFEININGYDVTYSFDGQELTNTGFTADNSHFAVGIHMPTLSRFFNFELSSFFGSPEFLQMYVAGNGVKTFEGKVYRVGFSDQINYESISEHFQENGIVDNEDEALIEGHYASYTLSPFFRYGTYFLDISISAQWEEYFPLSSFASYIDLSEGKKAYELDYLQFNVGYPSLVRLISVTTDNPNWSYQDLFNIYNNPIQKSYQALDDELLTGYENYADLAENVVTEYQIDRSGSSLSAYATFQLIAEGADEPLSSFSQTKDLTDSYTVYAENENTTNNPYNAYKTKFRIVDGTIIYPPKKISFENVAMVIHFEIDQDGIISNPLQIRNMEITSKVLNKNGFTEIGTKTGLPIYPYVRTGIYYSGKSKNPVMISKNSLPYLYLTEKGGIRVLENDDSKEYGIIVPINKNKSTSYSLGSIQMFMKYDMDRLITTPQTIFTLSYPNAVIEGILTADVTGKRFSLSLIDQQTKQEVEAVSFYQNGIKTNTPYLSKDQWNSIAISFDQSINLSSYTGSLNLFSGCSFDNISFFKSEGLGEFGVTIPRIWRDVLYGDEEQDPLNIVDWQYWYDENGALSIPKEWKDVYVLEESVSSAITPKQIYETYMGTNIIIVDDDSGVSLANDDFTMFADQTWLKVVDKPA